MEENSAPLRNTLGNNNFSYKKPEMNGDYNKNYGKK